MEAPDDSVGLLVLLAPWIEAGLVILIPDPGDFNRSLRVKTWDLALARLKGWEPGAEDLDQSAMKQRTLRAMLLAPRSYSGTKGEATESWDFRRGASEAYGAYRTGASERSSSAEQDLGSYAGTNDGRSHGSKLGNGDVHLSGDRRVPVHQRESQMEGNTWRAAGSRRDCSDMEPPNKYVSATQVQVPRQG